MGQRGDGDFIDLLNYVIITWLNDSDASLIKSKFIKPKDKYPPDTFAHIPNIAMLNSIENQLYKIYAKDNAPKNYFSYQDWEYIKT